MASELYPLYTESKSVYVTVHDRSEGILCTHGHNHMKGITPNICRELALVCARGKSGKSGPQWNWNKTIIWDLFSPDLTYFPEAPVSWILTFWIVYYRFLWRSLDSVHICIWGSVADSDRFDGKNRMVLHAKLFFPSKREENHNGPHYKSIWSIGHRWYPCDGSTSKLSLNRVVQDYKTLATFFQKHPPRQWTGCVWYCRSAPVKWTGQSSKTSHNYGEVQHCKEAAMFF